MQILRNAIVFMRVLDFCVINEQRPLGKTKIENVQITYGNTPHE